MKYKFLLKNKIYIEILNWHNKQKKIIGEKLTKLVGSVLVMKLFLPKF